MSDVAIPIRHLRAACDMVQKAGGDNAGTTGQLVIDLAVSLAQTDGADGIENTDARLKALARTRTYRGWTT